MTFELNRKGDDEDLVMFRRTTRFPVRLSATPVPCRSTPPRVGQDDHVVLRSVLGLDDDAIRRLAEAGVIQGNV